MQANVTSTKGNVEVYNRGTEDVQVKGHITSAKDVSINTKDGGIIIGSTTANNSNNILAAENVNLYSYNGSILNAGTTNTIVKAGGDLTAKAIDGTIGLGVRACPDGVCIGVDPGSRDLTKSINVEIDGLVTANTLRTENNKDNLLINIASKEADLNIDQIHARGDVLLLAGETNETSASILNAAKDDAVANVQGEGISIIASNNIGSADKALTFNQTNTDKGFDLLAIKDINVKGLDDKYDTNACTILSREGNVKAEFSGNTIIKKLQRLKILMS